MLFWALERNVGRTELTIKVKDNKIILKKKKKNLDKIEHIPNFH